jgi:hypothetical protein
MSSISLNLKFRKKRLSILAEDINKKKEGSLTLLNTYDDILSKTLSFSRLYVVKVIGLGNLWLFESGSNINSVNFSDSNSLYLKILGIKILKPAVLEFNFKALISRKGVRTLKPNKTVS